LPLFRDARAIIELMANEQEGGYSSEQVRLLQDGEATKTTLVADLNARPGK
jgi:hypothetical protein